MANEVTTSTNKWKMPDITPAQWKTTVGVVIALLDVNLKLNVSDSTQALITAAVVAVWGAVIAISDVFLRRGRAKIVAAEVYADAAQGESVPGPFTPPPTNVDVPADNDDSNVPKV